VSPDALFGSMMFFRKRTTFAVSLASSALVSVALIAIESSGLALSSSPSILSGKKRAVERVSAGPIEISALGCGTWSWGNRLLFNYSPDQDDEIYEAYRVVRDAGVTVFDTADSYGTLDLNGRAEILLGKFERRYLAEQMESSSKDNMGSFFQDIFSSPSTIDYSQQVATKLAPYPWRVTRSSIVEATKASLKRLGQEKLTLAQAHWSTSKYQPFQERALWDGLADVYDAGLCEAVGVSNYGPKQLTKVAAYMEKRQVPLATAQVQFSLLTYKDAVSRDMVEACDSAGCRLISYSPLCLGLLTGKYSVETNTLPPPGNPRRQLFTELLPGAQPLLRLLEAVAKDAGKTQSQVAINWALCKGGVPIPGARTLQQAQENVGAAGWRLSNGAMDELDRAALSISKPMIQNIFQTN
jgi:pyridoxine 4-dehydrogenase